MRVRSILAPSIACCFALSFGGSAKADDAVDEAWRMYLSADFEGALVAFDQAEAGPLERADLLRILEGRAQIYFALGDEDAVRGALSRLASLSPEYRLSPETPPDLVETFEAIRETTPTIRIEVNPARTDEGVRFSASVHGDVGGLVRTLRITGRADGGPWEQAEDEPLFVEAASHDAVEYYVEATGAGGAVLAAEGTAARPRRVTGDASGLVTEGSDDFLGIPVWGWVAIGGGVLAAAVLVAVILVVSGGDATQPEAPELP